MQLDLFDFAQSSSAKVSSGEKPTWEEPGATLWSRAWLANVRRLCAPKYASELAFGEKMLHAGRMTSCRVRRAHAQVTFTNREGGTALVNLVMKPLSPERWLALDRLCERCGDALFCSDDLPDDVVSHLFAQPEGLLPDWKDISFSCSHCRTPFCLYRAAALFAVATEFDQKPIKLFELRGATRELLFMRASQQVACDAEQIPEEEMASLFGIDLV